MRRAMVWGVLAAVCGAAGCSSSSGSADSAPERSPVLPLESGPAKAAAAERPAAVLKPAKAPWPAGVARGVAWDANWSDKANWYGTKGAEKGLDNIQSIGINWIAVTPFSFQKNVHKPNIRFDKSWDQGMAKDIVNAHARGIKVMLKPHIWSNQFWDGSNHWRGTIQMQSEADWVAWFKDYKAWIVYEASMAEKHKADAFCVGLEYLESSRNHADKWRDVIEAVRAVYSGPLTYAAHPSEVDLPFWDDLDVIGVNAYYVMSQQTPPDLNDMKDRWDKLAVDLSALSARFDRPIIFSEVGYASIQGAARAPFRWPNDSDIENQKEQAACYQALMEKAPSWPWFAGMFIWKYKITVPSNNAAERHYVFQGKAAEDVIKAGFSSTFAREKKAP